MVKIESCGQAVHPLHVFLKKFRGKLYIHMVRDNYLTRIDLEELPHLVRMLVYFYVATGGRPYVFDTLQSVVMEALGSHEEFERSSIPRTLNQSMEWLSISGKDEPMETD